MAKRASLSRKVSRPRRLTRTPRHLHLGSLSHREGIFNVDAQAPDGHLYLRVIEDVLHRPEVIHFGHPDFGLVPFSFNSVFIRLLAEQASASKDQQDRLYGSRQAAAAPANHHRSWFAGVPNDAA